MKLYLIAGEASGDLHGGNLIKALSRTLPDAEFRAWGGDQMQAAGATLVKHIRDLAFMGFWEVARNLRTILGNIKACKSDILAYQPDALILIDYPGFNLRIAEWAEEQGIRVFYYISPQLWAWKAGRVKIIKKAVERLFVILPFEADFYKKYEVEVDFVGHPLLDVVVDRPPDSDFRRRNGLSAQPIIALLPGSRKQEISRMLNVMLEVVPKYPDYQFVIAGAPAIDVAFYEELFLTVPAAVRERVQLVQHQTYALLQHSAAALVTSGTATLETALFNVPQVVCYKGSQLSFMIARRLVKVSYISLVNLIADKLIVTECIQQDCTPERLGEELDRLLDEQSVQPILAGYQEVRQLLGDAGASQRTAQLIAERLRGNAPTSF